MSDGITESRSVAWSPTQYARADRIIYRFIVLIDSPDNDANRRECRLEVGTSVCCVEGRQTTIVKKQRTDDIGRIVTHVWCALMTYNSYVAICEFRCSVVQMSIIQYTEVIERSV